MSTWDAIVVGTGGAGSAALYHLARRGARVLGLDRFPPAHDRGSSHGQSRVIRQAYFEHPDYVPLVRRAYDLWDELAAETGREGLRVECGLLQVGLRDGPVLTGVRNSAEKHGLEIEELSATETMRRFAGVRMADPYVGIFERKAGCLAVEQCVLAHLDAARKHGAELRTGETVMHWYAEASGVVVETDRQRYRCERLVLAPGAWAGGLLAELAVPFEVRRKPLFWYAVEAAEYRADRGFPVVLCETPDGVFYTCPAVDDLGLKVAEHSGGRIVPDPLEVDRQLDDVERQRVEAFLAGYLPSVSRQLTGHSVCMYTMTPDEHFIVDRHPVCDRVVFAAGLSGHGFKFTGVLGLTLTELALDGTTTLPIDFLKLDRPALQTAP